MNKLDERTLDVLQFLKRTWVDAAKATKMTPTEAAEAKRARKAIKRQLDAARGALAREVGKMNTSCFAFVPPMQGADALWVALAFVPVPAWKVRARLKAALPFPTFHKRAKHARARAWRMAAINAAMKATFPVGVFKKALPPFPFHLLSKPHRNLYLNPGAE